MKRRVIRAIDLCAGCGGWACAAADLPIHIERAYDIWEPAVKTYQLNHPTTKVIQADIRDEKTRADVLEHSKGIDLVLGGIPCEWLSLYRNLQGVGSVEMEDQRKVLDSVLDLVKTLGPAFWCLEDVPGIIKHLPILTPHVTLNSRDWSPQRRKRTYVGDFPPPPLAKNDGVMRDRLRQGPYRVGRRSFGREPKISRTFTKAAVLAGHMDQKSPTIASASSRRDAEMVIVDKSLPGGHRQMEWQEAALLQGFPTDYLFYGSPSDVSAMVGRAVQIDTARAILQSISRAFEKGPR